MQPPVPLFAAQPLHQNAQYSAGVLAPQPSLPPQQHQLPAKQAPVLLSVLPAPLQQRSPRMARSPRRPGPSSNPASVERPVQLLEPLHLRPSAPSFRSLYLGTDLSSEAPAPFFPGLPGFAFHSKAPENPSSAPACQQTPRYPAGCSGRSVRPNKPFEASNHLYSSFSPPFNAESQSRPASTARVLATSSSIRSSSCLWSSFS